MSTTTPWQVEQTLAEFGRGIGLPALRASEQGRMRLNIENVGELSVETADGGDTVLVYLVRRLFQPSAAAYRKMLELCGPRERLAYPVQAALRGDDRAAFCVRLRQDEFQLPALETALDQLRRLHDRLSQVAS